MDFCGVRCQRFSLWTSYLVPFSSAFVWSTPPSVELRYAAVCAAQLSSFNAISNCPEKLGRTTLLRMRTNVHTGTHPHAYTSIASLVCDRLVASTCTFYPYKVETFGKCNLQWVQKRVPGQVTGQQLQLCTIYNRTTQSSKINKMWTTFSV